MATPPPRSGLDHRATSVGEIAAASRGPIVALGAYDSRVQVWDVAARSRLASFETVLDCGGRRLALNADGSRVLAAGYDRRGVACYDARSGEEIWLRRDLTQVQHLSTGVSPDVAFACADIRSCHVLAVETGVTLEALRGVRAVYSTPYTRHRLRDRAKPVVEPGGTFERESFAILAAAFSPRQLLVSEAAGPVRAFRLNPFGEEWRWWPTAGRHVLAVEYSETSAQFVAVEYPYESDGPFVLGGFAQDGSWIARAVVPPAAAVQICDQGRFLLLADGRLVDAASGSLAGVLPLQG